MPLDRMQSTALDYRLRQILGRPGVIGVASELVQFDRQIQVAVDFLLGTTIVVRDLETGMALGREGFRARYVSLDGQLINPSGSMTGGSIKATGLMTREREIRTLAETVTGLEKKQETLRAQIERVQIELSTAHNRIEALQMELDTRRLELNSAQKDLESTQRAVNDVERTRDERRAQLERIEDSVSQLRETIARAGEQHRVAAEQFAAVEARLSEERELARTQGSDIFTLGTSVAEERAEIEKSRERAQEAITHRQTAERDLESLTRQRQNRTCEIEELHTEDLLLTEQIDRIKQEMEGSSGEFERLAQVLNHSQAEREGLLERLKEYTQAVELLQRDERDLDNKTRELELRRTELHANYENISAQCVEKFQMELGALTEALGEVDKDQHGLAVDVTEMKDKLERMGPVNMAALDEYREQGSRFEFLKGQHKDLNEAKEQLTTTIARLDETTRKLFHETFEAVRANFIEMFRRLFNGGNSDLVLEAPDGLDPLLDGGIEIMAQPPGKKLQNIGLMSGGEKAMTAISLLFGLFMYKPSPFCIMDEIDAPLDDINVERFKQMIDVFNKQTQFMIITHNKLTMELADAIYGVTMEESGVSKLVSVRFEQAEALVDAV
jgi:chromosome segregation protein